MGRPRKNVDSIPATKAPEADEPQQMQLEPLELAQLQLHQTRMQLQSNLIENIRMKMDLLSIKYKQDHAVLQGMMKSADDSRSEAQRDYNSQLGAVEKRLGIRMAEYAVDDITGILRHETTFQ